MVTSRSVPQLTAQIFSPLAGQKRTALRFSQIGQDTESPKRGSEVSRIRRAATKDKIRQAELVGQFDVNQAFLRSGLRACCGRFHLSGKRVYQALSRCRGWDGPKCRIIMRCCSHKTTNRSKIPKVNDVLRKPSFRAPSAGQAKPLRFEGSGGAK